MQTYHQLLEKLRQEGTYDKYLSYLQMMYGNKEAGSQYGLGIDACEVKVDEDFLEYALSKDLAKKSLQIIAWIADAEQEFSPTPYFTALDRYYRINPQQYSTKEEITSAVRELEHIFSGKAELFEDYYLRK